MASDDEESQCDCVPGLPAWMGTFADLMSLLMCFFVLLLSFSEMDAMKFQRLAGSMAEAFGVQAEHNAVEIPKGTSIIAQEFSPGRPDPTPINEVWQKTSDITELSLETRTDDAFDTPRGEALAGDAQAVTTQSASPEAAELAKALLEATRADAEALSKLLAPAIGDGSVDVETRGRQIVVRIREQGSFRSGSAELTRESLAMMEDLQLMLSEMPGQLRILGHTDNQPINTAKFPSNWSLSAARAVAVGHALMRGGDLSPQRFEVAGKADTEPMADNATAAGRSQNRRVEILVEQGLDADLSPADRALLNGAEGADIRRELDLAPDYPFKLRPDEVF